MQRSSPVSRSIQANPPPASAPPGPRGAMTQHSWQGPSAFSKACAKPESPSDDRHPPACRDPRRRRGRLQSRLADEEEADGAVGRQAARGGAAAPERLKPGRRSFSRRPCRRLPMPLEGVCGPLPLNGQAPMPPVPYFQTAARRCQRAAGSLDQLPRASAGRLRSEAGGRRLTTDPFQEGP